MFLLISYPRRCHWAELIFGFQPKHLTPQLFNVNCSLRLRTVIRNLRLALHY